MKMPKLPWKRRKKEITSLPTIEQIKKERRRVRRSQAYVKALSRTVAVLVSVAAVAVLITTLFLPVLQITGDSMTPTLENDNIVVLVKTKSFKTGDICAFSWKNRTLLKRVIGLPGDKVDIDNEGNVSVNGEKLDEPYLKEKSHGDEYIADMTFPYQVPDSSLFLLGDHRATSVDSRSTEIGAVHYRYIIGKVAFRIWPLDRIGGLN